MHWTHFQIWLPFHWMWRPINSKSERLASEILYSCGQQSDTTYSLHKQLEICSMSLLRTVLWKLKNNSLVGVREKLPNIINELKFHFVLRNLLLNQWIHPVPIPKNLSVCIKPKTKCPETDPLRWLYQANTSILNCCSWLCYDMHSAWVIQTKTPILSASICNQMRSVFEKARLDCCMWANVLYPKHTVPLRAKPIPTWLRNNEVTTISGLPAI